jgi:hypothetical protein
MPIKRRGRRRRGRERGKGRGKEKKWMGSQNQF